METEFYFRNKNSPLLQSLCKKCANKDCRERANRKRQQNPKKLGGQRHYELNESAFETIDNEQKAYWLGFMYADGYNGQSKGIVTLGLAEEDNEHIQKFRKFLGSNAPIKIRSPRRRYEQNMCVFNACSKKLCENLKKWGCMQAKTFKIQVPRFLPPNLLRAFVRGYFDGDGSVGTNKCEEGNSNFTIVSNVTFLTELKKIIETSCSINTQISKKFNGKQSSIQCLSSNGNIQVFKFLRWIYKDCSVCLSRKFNRYLKLKTYLFTRPPKRGQKSIE